MLSDVEVTLSIGTAQPHRAHLLPGSCMLGLGAGGWLEGGGAAPYPNFPSALSASSHKWENQGRHDG